MGNIQMYVIIAFAPMIVLSVVSVPFVKALLSIRPFVFLGSVSMSIFIWHFPIQVVWEIASICGAPIDFSSKKIWLAYVVSVIAISFFYDRLLKNRLECFVRAFLYEKRILV